MNILDKKKIAIFGWPASCKSTLGRVLSGKLGIELYSLDLIRWKYSSQCIKDDEKFLEEYETILKRDEWIIEGNALDWIDSRLKLADVLIFFDSTVEKCIENYQNRASKIAIGEEERLNCDSSKDMDSFVDWVTNRYSKKIERLRPILDDYKDKLIVINDYEELNRLIENIDIQVGT